MAMAKHLLAAAALGAVLIDTAHAQRSSRWDVVDESTVSRTLAFAGGGGRTLDVRNISGFIRVESSSDSTVQMDVRKVIRAATQSDLADAQRDVRLDFTDGAPSVGAVVTDQRGQVCGERSNDRDRGRDRVDYEVRFDFTIRAPQDVALRLCTINGSDVTVTGTRGDFDVTNVNGRIEMRQVAGSGRAHTVNGSVAVSFTANPTQPSSFKTVNGSVNVEFVDGLSAEFAMKTLNGGLYTDFEVQPLAGAASPAGERRNGRFVYRGNEFSRMRVGNGGPLITFETLNGSVRARRAGA
jgi:hypothetical protein